MNVNELLRSFTLEDLESTLGAHPPGLRPPSSNEDIGDNMELIKIFEAAPVVKKLMGMSVSCVNRGDLKRAKFYNVFINLVVLIYKKQQNQLVDKLLASK